MLMKNQQTIRREDPMRVAIAMRDFSQVRQVLVAALGEDAVVECDVEMATRTGVLVANEPSIGGGNAESVAELAVSLMMILGRQIPTALQRFRERRFSGPMGRTLWGSAVVILGYGSIGQEIARRLGGFGARLIAVSRHGPESGRSDVAGGEGVERSGPQHQGMKVG
jgi:lactate dehydrogenase-like 2-hydroxyacid dehydrogenase